MPTLVPEFSLLPALTPEVNGINGINNWVCLCGTHFPGFSQVNLWGEGGAIPAKVVIPDTCSPSSFIMTTEI